MIVKRLREQRHWSQEQLATMSGLSTRTIQRIETGNKASIESLKALAAVFEVDIQTLKEEITVINKASKAWLNEPWWFRIQYLGVASKGQARFIEYAAFVIGVFLIFFEPNPYSTPIPFVIAYGMTKLNHRMDTKNLW